MKQILEKARDLVAKGWCQRSYAKDATGRNVAYGNSEACEFCASGALLSASYHLLGSDQYIGARRAFANVANADIVWWNDIPGRTQAEVVAAFDRAIEAMP